MCITDIHHAAIPILTLKSQDSNYNETEKMEILQEAYPA